MVRYRFFESEEDLQLQYTFWEQRTAALPFAWKMTKSPTIYRDQESFHPKSRCFAFVGEELVGYMSFTASGSFISLGYPWVKPGYEEIRDELYERVYSFAASEYGGEMFAQRFREQWTDQIDYFQQKGFEITNESSLLGGRIDKELLNEVGPLRIKEGFSYDEWKAIELKNGEATSEQLDQMKEYYSSVDFDFSVILEKEDETVGLMAVTIRPDTSYAEVLALAMISGFENDFDAMFQAAQHEIVRRGGDFVTINKAFVPSNSESRLEEVTKDVMMVKEVE